MVQEFNNNKSTSLRSLVKEIKRKEEVENKVYNPNKIVTQDALFNRRFEHMSEYYLDIVDPKTKKKVDKEYSWAFSVLEDGSEESIQVGVYNACYVLYDKYSKVAVNGAAGGAWGAYAAGGTPGEVLMGTAIGIATSFAADWVGSKVFDHYDKQDFPMNNFIKKNDLLSLNGIKKFNKRVEDLTKRLMGYKSKVKRYNGFYRLEYGPTWYDDPGLGLDYLNSNNLDMFLNYKDIFKYFSKYVSIVNNAYGKRSDKAIFEGILKETDMYITMLAAALDEHLKFVFRHIKVV